MSKAHIGVIAEKWMLDTVPSTTVSVGPDSSSDFQVATSRSPIHITLRAHSGSEDDTISRRTEVATVLSHRSLQSFLELEVYKCIRRVRTPVRIKDLLARKEALFISRNEALLSSLEPLFLSSSRIDDFFVLQQQTEECIAAVRIKHSDVQQAVVKLVDEGATGFCIPHSLSMDGYPPRLLARSQQNRRSLFPESILVKTAH